MRYRKNKENHPICEEEGKSQSNMANSPQKEGQPSDMKEAVLEDMKAESPNTTNDIDDKYQDEVISKLEDLIRLNEYTNDEKITAEIKNNGGSLFRQTAEGDFLNEILEKEISREAHIIHPNSFSCASVLSSNRKSSDEGAINLSETIADLVKKDGGTLKKPIIAILNDSSEKTTDYKRIGGSHWVLCCILPKDFEAKAPKIRKSRLGNKKCNETQVLLLDPYYPDT